MCMKCINCNCTDLKKMILISSPGGKVRAVKEISKNRYEHGADMLVSAFVCQKCGHIELFAESKIQHE